MRNCPIQAAEMRYNTEVPVDINAENDRDLIIQLRGEMVALFAHLSNTSVNVNEALIDVERLIRQLPSIRERMYTTKGIECIENVQKSILWKEVFDDVKRSVDNEDMRQVLWGYVDAAKAECSADMIPENDDF